MDDVALIYKNKDELQNMLDIMDEIAKRYHIKFGQEKSLTITIGKTPETPFKLGQMDLENLSTYKYIGTTINNKGTMEDHINKLKGKAEATIQTIFNIAGNNNFSKIEMKTIWKLIDTCLIPTLLYATETWTTTKNEINNIQIIFDNIIKRILKTPTTTPSEIIQIETGFLSIESMVHEKQLMYYHRIHNNNKCQTTDLATNPKTLWNLQMKKNY